MDHYSVLKSRTILWTVPKHPAQAYAASLQDSGLQTSPANMWGLGTNREERGLQHAGVGLWDNLSWTDMPGLPPTLIRTKLSTEKGKVHLYIFLMSLCLLMTQRTTRALRLAGLYRGQQTGTTYLPGGSPVMPTFCSSRHSSYTWTDCIFSWAP